MTFAAQKLYVKELNEYVSYLLSDLKYFIEMKWNKMNKCSMLHKEKHTKKVENMNGWESL